MKDRIYIKEWLLMKPYESQVPSDFYYVKLSNDIHQQIIKATIGLDIKATFENSEEVLRKLACFLASYVEDVASESHIWKTFTQVYKDTYHKTLPLINMSDTYIEGEVNHEDINFLIWYFANTFQDIYIFAHDEKWIVQVTDALTPVLQKAWEVAPENDYLQSYYQLGTGLESFFEVRKVIEKLLLQSYLFFPDVKVGFMYQLQKIIAEDKGDQATMLIWNQQTYTYHNLASRLMGMFGNEWAAAYVGKEHALYEDILQMGRKLSAAFLYKGAKDEVLHFEQVASGKPYDVAKTSMYEAVLNEGEVHYIDLVSWQGKYWMSGITYKLNADEAFMKSEKENPFRKNAIDALLNPAWVKPGLKEELAFFRKNNNNEVIAFLKGNEVVNLFETMKENASTDAELAGREGLLQMINATLDRFKNNDSFKYEIFTTYFDPEVGLEFAFGVHEAFHHPRNPYFNIEKSGLAFLEMLTQDAISRQLVAYFLRTNESVVQAFPDAIKELWLGNLDFLLRFWKAKTYYLKAI